MKNKNLLNSIWMSLVELSSLQAINTMIIALQTMYANIATMIESYEKPLSSSSVTISS